VHNAPRAPVADMPHPSERTTGSSWSGRSRSPSQRERGHELRPAPPCRRETKTGAPDRVQIADRKKRGGWSAMGRTFSKDSFTRVISEGSWIFGFGFEGGPIGPAMPLNLFIPMKTAAQKNAKLPASLPENEFAAPFSGRKRARSGNHLIARRPWEPRAARRGKTAAASSNRPPGDPVETRRRSLGIVT